MLAVNPNVTLVGFHLVEERIAGVDSHGFVVEDHHGAFLDYR